MIAAIASFVQMFEVAFSRRMCCSRVCSVFTNPRVPFASTVWPTLRPGIWRTSGSRHAMMPRGGPPHDRGIPRGWAPAVERSYMEDFRPQSGGGWDMGDGYPKFAWGVPWLTSGWYGVYGVRNSRRGASTGTAAGM